MRGTVYQRCSCPFVRSPKGELEKDANGRSQKDHRQGCRPSWAIVFDVGQRGRRKQKTKSGFRTKREAEAALNAALEQVARGTFVDTGRMTVAEYLNGWLAGKQSLRETTRQSYRSHLDVHLIPTLGNVPLGELRHHHVELAFQQIGQRGSPPPGPTTLRRIHATLKSALNDAVRRHILTVNHALHVDLPKPAPRPRVVWTPAQLHQFLEGIESDPLALLYHLVAFTGLRRGEIAGLQWDDVDLQRSQLHIQRQIVVVRSSLSEVPPKSKTGDRVVSLASETVTRLRAHHLLQGAETVLRGQPPAPRYVFSREDGTPLHPEYIYRRFIRLCRALDLPKICLHELRHTHATHALAAGVQMKVVQERLGHSSIGLTANTYTHVLPEVAQEAAQLIAMLTLNAGGLAAREQEDENDDLKAAVPYLDAQVSTGAPPGTRTPNPRIKSPAPDTP